jgi:hypothetical protein
MIPNGFFLDRDAGRVRLFLGFDIVLVTFIKLLFAGEILLNDPDTWWHIRTGSEIWKSGHFPVTDTYSYTFFGKPWIAKEWLSQVIWFMTFSAGGWSGVVLLTIATVCFAAFIMFWILSRYLRPPLAAALALAAIFLSSITYVARPHIFALPLAILWTDRLFRTAESGRAPKPWLLLLVTLWANLHGSFTLAYMLAGFAFLHVIQKVGLSDRALLARWGAFLTLCVLASLIHPYGWQPLVINFQLASGNEAMAFLTEWQPLTAASNRMLEMALLAVVGGLLWLRLRLSAGKILFIVFAMHMFMLHLRFVYLFFLLVPLVVAPEIGEQHRSLSFGRWREQGRDILERSLARYFTFGSAATMAAIVGAWALTAIYSPFVPPGYVSAAGAIAYAKEAGLKGNVINFYNFGGPLILHGIPTFIDGRAEQLFGGGFAADVDRTVKPGGEKLFAELLDKYKVAWSLLPNGDPRNRLLDEMGGWSRAYEDQYAIIHVRKNFAMP